MEIIKTVIVILSGLILGSFLSVLIERLHSGEGGILTGRSHCANCKHKLSAGNLIPLLSYLIQKGRCEFCKKKISIFYPALELSAAILFLLLFSVSPNLTFFILKASLFLVLIFIFFYDLRYKEIHDAVMIPAIIWAFILSFFFANPTESIYGGILGAAFFSLQWLASRGKWVGSGDIRIGAFMGLMLGLKLCAAALIFSYIMGSTVGIFMMVMKKVKPGTQIPFGPFLSVGTIISFFFGERIIAWYLNLMI